jgi:transposase
MGQASPASLGIDVAKATFEAALLVDGKMLQRSFAMTVAGFDALHTGMSKQGVERVHVCLEAPDAYGAALALSLHEAGHVVVVSLVNPARIAAYAKSRLTRTKTDQADAALIAHVCYTQHPLAWTPPLAEVRELQARVRRVEMRQEMAQQEVNRLQSGSALAIGARFDGGHTDVLAARDCHDAAPSARAGGAVGGSPAQAACALLDPGGWALDRRARADRE